MRADRKTTGIQCAACGCCDLRVTNTEPLANGLIRRRRVCRHCGRKRVTLEGPPSALHEAIRPAASPAPASPLAGPPSMPATPDRPPLAPRRVVPVGPVDALGLPLAIAAADDPPEQESPPPRRGGRRKKIPTPSAN